MTVKYLRYSQSDKNDKQSGLIIPVNLSFFEGDQQDKDSKTEQPTEKKLKDARQEGQVAKSQEISTAASMLVMFFSLSLFGPWLYRNIVGLIMYDFGMIPYSVDTMNAIFAAGYVTWFFQQVIIITLPLLAISFILGIVVNLIQVGWEPTAKPMMPKLSKVNPISGFKRIFSMQSIVNLVKSLAKLAFVGLVVFFVLRSRINLLPAMFDMEMITAVLLMVNMAISIGLAVGVLFIFIAALDYAYTRYSHIKKLRMTKQEVKDEYKQQEGDPKIKSKIRQKMQEASMRRMMQSVPQADVVITNPTHYAVALRYNNMVDKAPVVLAKGVDFAAKRIRDKAKEHDIIIVENPALARTLYAEVDVGQEIPFELWEAVVEILAYVFKLKHGINDREIENQNNLPLNPVNF